MLHGIIFDLDGTLVDSRLDFDQMRREMNLPPGAPVLETLETLSADEARRCRRILEAHERAGAERACVLPGVVSLLGRLERLGARLAVVTRNSRAMALAMLQLLPCRFDPVLTRDDGPVKPDPWAIRRVCKQWGVAPREAALVGDFRFDIEAGRRAGAHTVLLAAVRGPDSRHGADLVLPSLTHAEELIAWLERVG